MKKYDVVIVGGGLSGLTTAAYLSRAGKSVLLCEREKKVGGLLGSFEYKGFLFDIGARAIEDSGVFVPMLRQLGINLPLLKNPVTIGIENDTIAVNDKGSLNAYQAMLIRQFPEEKAAVTQLMKTIRQVMDDMDILYGIENPLFMDLKNDKTYLRETLMPWLFKYITTVGKIKRYKLPIEAYLKTLTDSDGFADIIGQHFFAHTPAFFALSYFSLYLDYRYPKGGTGALIDALETYILAHGGEIKPETSIDEVHLKPQTVVSRSGESFGYQKLIWCADSKALYRAVNTEGLSLRQKQNISQHQSVIAHHRGGDSVLTLYVTSSAAPEYFSSKHSAHFFYTPKKQGTSSAPLSRIMGSNGSLTKEKKELFDWMGEYLALTTYEISIPCLRDADLAPSGKTGLIISTLFNYDLIVHLNHLNLYDEAKAFISDTIITVLENSLYPNFKKIIRDSFASTPLTIENTSGNSDGAITGWSFESGDVPAVDQMSKIAQSVKTPLPGVLQAGQWSYSPSGLPISMLTGKMAADAAIKALKRVR